MTPQEVRRYFEMTQQEAEQTRKELKAEVRRNTKPAGKKNRDGIYYQALRIVAYDRLQIFINIRMSDTLEEAMEATTLPSLERLQALYESYENEYNK